MRVLHLALPLVALLAACQMDPTGRSKDENGTDQTTSNATGASDDYAMMMSRDPEPGSKADPTLADDKERPIMQMQVVLDRLGFTPGVVDGREGLSTRNAISGFQESRDLEVTGKLDEATKQALHEWSNIPATRLVTIPADFAAGPFTKTPDGAREQARLDRLGYQSLEEKLAERFHTTSETLRELNPNLSSGDAPHSAASATPEPSGSPSPEASSSNSIYYAGQQIRVPNIGADKIEPGKVDDQSWLATLQSLGVGSTQPQAAKIVVSKSKETLKVFDEAGKLVGMYTATMGSSHDPLPLGDWKITGVAHNPDFAFDPTLLWDVPDSAEKQRLPPGPNGPVGVAWIDLSKEHYGIHGTPEPQTIGRVQSHGCVRLTNWDVARLAQMVSTKTQVLFEA
ncbi:MAG: murein L,D-transpeptidase [Novosphingobium sp.]|nr:murein L,D-transpeptidase [Novosphingobium sp.]